MCVYVCMTACTHLFMYPASALCYDIQEQGKSLEQLWLLFRMLKP